jgi:hypothetical protein
MSDVKQLRLVSGEELLCEIIDVQWDDEVGEESFIIRAAYTLVSQEDFENGYRYYTFRPFMMHIHDPSHVLVLNSAAVICLTKPHQTVIDQYIKHMEVFRNEERQRMEKDQDALLEQIVAEDEEVLDEISKVVTLRPKPKLH